MPRIPHIFASAMLGALILLGVTGGPSRAQAEDRVFRLLVPDYFTIDYLNLATNEEDGFRNWLSVQDCVPIDDPSLANVLRHQMELFIVCQALREGDVADIIELVPFPNPRRALVTLLDGGADAFGVSLFPIVGKGFEKDVLISAPVLTDQQFPVALFTAPNREDVLQARTREQILALRGVTNENWRVDHATMKQLGLAAALTAEHHNQVGAMIANDRADFTFFFLDVEETEPDMFGQALVRIEGVQSRLQASRHIFFAKSQRDAFATFERFLKTYRAKDPDAILEAYYHSGFLSRAYDDWLLIVPE